jgi:hypothetical protein
VDIKSPNFNRILLLLKKTRSIGKGFLAVVEQQIKNAAQISLFWVAFLI